MAKTKQPVQKQRAFVEVGATGLRRAGGYVREEFLPELSGQQGRRVIREMAWNDPIVAGVLFAIEMLIRRVSWRVRPASSARDDQLAAQFVEECRTDMSSSWADLIAEILSMLPYGWAYHEIVYKRRGGDSRDPKQHSRFDDGLIGWRKVPIRAQDTLLRWEFDDEGGIQGMYQVAEPDYRIRYLPIAKSLLFRTGTYKNNPEGVSLLRRAYRPWYFKKRIEEIEAIGIERDLAGMPVAWVPPEVLRGDSDEMKQALETYKEIVTNLKRDEQEGVVMPAVYDEHGNKLYDLTLLTSGGRRQFDTSAVVARYDQRIAMVVLADFILLGHEKIGTQALSVTKAQLFATALQAWVDSIAEVFNRHAIPRLLHLNPRFRVRQLPQLEPGEVEAIDMRELAEVIRQLTGAGVIVPDDELEEYVRAQTRLPPRQEGGEPRRPARGGQGQSSENDEGEEGEDE